VESVGEPDEALKMDNVDVVVWTGTGRPGRSVVMTGRERTPWPVLRLVHPLRDPGEVARWRAEQWRARPWTRPSTKRYPVLDE
jgi:hypothetical protein